ncbi:hypothetical protein BMF94_6156 [Rhodotorula taiwanensis]|uniref:Uncharacterized protein n=1 Tax=Rhodotorula taiwanensis TaxID=741276 RepID=A0A2S5B1V9_9BASI|nr:hypothetical protein BMF94_6156 [Rhodotorula taiwanensis]
MYRTAVATLRLTAPRRAFYVSSISAEKDLNHRAGDVLLKGIEKAEAATETVKEAAQPITETVSNLAGQAKTEGKKAAADVEAKSTQVGAEIKGQAKKAKAELERP